MFTLFFLAQPLPNNQIAKNVVPNAAIAIQLLSADDPRLGTKSPGIENHRWLRAPFAMRCHAQHVDNRLVVPIASTIIVPHVSQ